VKAAGRLAAAVALARPAMAAIGNFIFNDGRDYFKEFDVDG
jgi:hypothetical protein